MLCQIHKEKLISKHGDVLWSNWLPTITKISVVLVFSAYQLLGKQHLRKKICHQREEESGFQIQNTVTPAIPSLLQKIPPYHLIGLGTFSKSKTFRNSVKVVLVVKEGRKES